MKVKDQAEESKTFIEIRKNLGRNLKNVRKEKGLTQVQLVDKLNKAGLPINQSEISKTEAGTRRIEFAEVIFYARVLEVDPSQFIAS